MFVMHVEYLLLHVMCMLMHVYVLVGVNVSVIMCILVWIHVHVCVAPPIVVGAWPMAGTLWRLFDTMPCITETMYCITEELGRHRGREGKSECTSCGACESMVHVLWECSAYSSSRASFMLKLEELLVCRF